MDCGPTCLAIIARHYGRLIDRDHLRQLSHTGREGSSLLGISRAAEDIGFNTLAVKASLDKMQKEAPLPFIAHWNQNHFVVVYKITKNRVFVSDPASGLLKYPKIDFLQSWIGSHADKGTDEGIALLLEPTPSFYELDLPEGKDDALPARRFLWHYLRPHQRLLGQVLLSLVLASVLQLVLPFLTQNIVDTGIAKRDMHFIWLVLIAQLMITAGQLFIEVLRSWMLLHISGRINIRLISDFFIKLMRLPIRYFDSRLTGDIFQRISDHRRIESFITGSSLGVLFSVFTLLLYGGVLAYYSLVLFGIFALGSVLYILWILLFMKRREKLDYMRFRQAADNNSKEIELINGMQEIKLHNAEQEKRWAWERIQVQLYKISMKSLALEQTQNSGSRIINELKNILITVFSASLVIRGEITLGMMLAVSFIIGQLNAPIQQLVGVIKSWQDAHISFDRITEIYQKEEEQNTQQNIPMAHHEMHQQDIHLQGLSFAYDALSPQVLQQLDITLPHGQVTAIVGSSGSGKTTLLKMLMRFYEPTEGVIKLGNTNLWDTDLYQWRDICGVVMQEGHIFNDTIMGNIALGQSGHVDIERLKKAAYIANIDDFVESLPLGYKTKIGMEGMGISTGQKQRILIARAVYKDPDILLFDEATSALDAENEKQIMEKLEDFYKNKTVVIIAHRLSTVKNADNIIVLEKGKIVEQGEHDKLIDTEGRYYELIKNQLELGT